jgi:hypothetical protein
MKARATIAGLLLTAVLASGCISAERWQSAKAHIAGVGVGVILGIVSGGTSVLAYAGVGLLGGVAVDQMLEPDPVEHVRTVTTVVDHPPPQADGSPSKPVVHTYVNKDPSQPPAGLKLPGGWDNLPDPLSWWEKVWKGIQVVWWCLLAVAVFVFVLAHPPARTALANSLRRPRPSAQLRNPTKESP